MTKQDTLQEVKDRMKDMKELQKSKALGELYGNRYQI